MKRALIALLVCTLAIAGRIAWSGSPAVSAQDAANWPQWGQNPQHTGTINVVGTLHDGCGVTIPIQSPACRKEGNATSVRQRVLILRPTTQAKGA
jgi:hypothetical protein